MLTSGESGDNITTVNVRSKRTTKERKVVKCAVDIVKMTLEAARRNVGLTQKEAAEKIGVSNKTLGNWEHGNTFPPVDIIPKICDLYGVSYDHINFLPNRSL